jgi:hypothetical protein
MSRLQCPGFHLRLALPLGKGAEAGGAARYCSWGVLLGPSGFQVLKFDHIGTRISAGPGTMC